MADSRLPLDRSDGLSSSTTVRDKSTVHLADDNDLTPRPTIAPTIPPGFEATVPTPKLESQSSSDMNYHVKLAILEQELMTRNAQFDEAMRANAHLSLTA